MEKDFSKDPDLLMILTPEEIEEYKGLFDMFDIDGSGDISVKELHMVMRQLGQNPTEEEIISMMNDADRDGNMSISFGEFCHLMTRKLKDNDNIEELEDVFWQIAKSGQDFIEHRDLKEFFVAQGTEVSIDDCKLLIKMHDLDGDGRLSFPEFVKSNMPL